MLEMYPAAYICPSPLTSSSDWSPGLTAAGEGFSDASAIRRLASCEMLPREHFRARKRNRVPAAAQMCPSGHISCQPHVLRHVVALPAELLKRPQSAYFDPAGFGFRLPHLAAAAFRAISDRRSGVSFSARARAPFLAPFRPIFCMCSRTSLLTRIHLYASPAQVVLQDTS